MTEFILKLPLNYDQLKWKNYHYNLRICRQNTLHTQYSADEWTTYHSKFLMITLKYEIESS